MYDRSRCDLCRCGLLIEAISAAIVITKQIKRFIGRDDNSGMTAPSYGLVGLTEPTRAKCTNVNFLSAKGAC
jgi:hypothetical protein